MRKELGTLLDQGLIEESTGAWSAPVVCVRKKYGSIRMCGDFRKLNAVTVPDPKFMPRVEELISRMAGAQYISKLDMRKGKFHSIQMIK